ncbi:MAG: N-acetylmuramoyl-L-alanine amidase [Ignavibacteriaceae bacterium]|nr:N-acetylmuramoyl-L-alanine amidase [Ignavibacteriaceae bacterium]
MEKIFFLILLLFSFGNSLAQQVENLFVVSDKGTKSVSAWMHEGILYVSISELAEALTINYFESESTGKVELKSNYFLLKSSPRNPFIVVTPRSSGTPKVYQLPTSTYFRGNETFIPLPFLLDPLEIIVERKLKFEKPNRLIVGKQITSPLDGKKWMYDIPDLPPTTGYDITGLSITEKVNGTIVRLHSKSIIPSYYSSFKDDELTIIFRKVNADVNKTSREEFSSLIQKIEVRNVGSDVEFKFKVGSDYSTNEVMNVTGSNDILITIHNKVFTKSDQVKKNMDKWNFDIVVIDAGHGGKDPGAIGIDNLKEKDVTLAIALKLGELMQKEMPDVGKLFISIHCNSTKKKPSDVSGAEVYLLRPGRTQEAIEIAETENSVIKYEDNPQKYEKLTDENFILVSMAHSAYMKYSEKFAELLHKEFDVNLKLKSRGVKQAGFYVLVGASMPSVLVETGFISNKNDAKFLKSAAGQNQVAESIFSSIKTYRKYYEEAMDAEL